MAWLSGFSNRLKLTIPPDNVDSNQTDFPVMIYLSTDSGANNYDASAVFDELDNDHQKFIAVTTNDEITQCPVEIEYWDSSEEKAILWTKIPTVYSTVDTDMYLYFDATYSGTTASGIGFGTTTSGNAAYVGDIRDLNSQMVVDIGDEGTYDINNAYYPCVIKDGATYKMWYTGYDGTYYRILYATSTDGITWTGHQMVLNYNTETTYDTLSVYSPYVIKESASSYKMWYSGYDGSYWRILYATSTNGTTWANHQMVVDIGDEGTYDTSFAWLPCVIKESDSSYKMWYSGQDGTNYRTLYAISDNGTTWSGHSMIINIGAEGTYDTTHFLAPCVLKEDSTYKMWYTGYQTDHPDLGTAAYRGIYTTSTDGITWGDFEFIIGTSLGGTYDRNHTATGMSVINDDGVYKMWYGGHNNSNWRIMYTDCWASPAMDVWASEYITTVHMHTDPSSGLHNSALSGDHGVSAGTMTPADLIDGRFGKAIAFDGVNDAIDFGPGSAPPATRVEDNYTYVGWYKTSDTHQIDSQSNSGTAGLSGQKYAFAPTTWGNSALSLGTNGISVYVHNDGVVPPLAVYNATIGSDWNHIAVVFTSKIPTIYLNGVAVHTGVAYTSPYQWTPYILGGNAWGWFTGQIDEVRVINTNKSAAFVKASYYNESDNFVVFQDDVPAGWLSDWAKRIELTIDSDKIDTTLDEFPVCLTLTSGTNAADVFSELYTVSGTRKIAVTTYNGVTQCPVEIQQWDWSEEEAILWTKVPAIDDAEDTTMYLYYDNTKSDNTSYVGVTGNLVAQDVWDDSFVGVYHMTQDPMAGGSSIINSAGVGNYGTPAGFSNWRSNGSIFTDEFTTTTSGEWTEYHTGTAESNWTTFENTECVEMVAYTGSNQAKMYRNDSNLDSSDRIVVTVRKYHDSIGTVTAEPFDIHTRSTDTFCGVRFGNNGVAVYDGSSYVTIGGSSGWVVEDEWHTWTFDIDFSTPASATVDIYLDGELKSAGEDCSHDAGGFTPSIHFVLYSAATTRRTYVDYVHVGTQFGVGSNLVDGKIGQAIIFDGTDDEISLGTHASLDLTSAFTYEAIFKTSTEVSQDIIAKFNETGTDYQSELHINATGSVASNFYNSVLTGVNCNTDNGLAGDFIDNLWHYVATGIDVIYGDGYSRLYMDGVLNVTSPTSISDINSLSTIATHIGERYNAGSDRHMTGTLDEIRISDVNRAASWIKATYYSSWNQLVTYGAPESMPVSPTHYYYGYITEDGTPAARVVRVHNRDTGALMSSTVSDAGSGYYYLTTTISGEHYIVTLDDDVGLSYNALVLDKLLPRGIE